MKMETLSRDTQYLKVGLYPDKTKQLNNILKQLRNLAIETDFAHHSGVYGLTSNKYDPFWHILAA